MECAYILCSVAKLAYGIMGTWEHGNKCAPAYTTSVHVQRDSSNQSKYEPEALRDPYSLRK